jgi:hypothetical protein
MQPAMDRLHDRARPVEGTGELLRRIAPIVATGVLLILAAFSLVTLLTDPRFHGTAGFDFSIYRAAAARWLHGGWFYYPEQVGGPYTTLAGHVMYPPPALLLFVPFTVLPAVLWWVIPIGIITWRIIALRPSPWAWVWIAACLAWPGTIELGFTGNPLVWVVAAMALATRWPWVSALVLVKPSLFPFALFGARDRRWWLALAACALVSAFFLPMWVDWIHVVLNARGPFSGALYSIKDVPTMLVPLFAWAGRTRELPRLHARPGRPADEHRFAINAG